LSIKPCGSFFRRAFDYIDSKEDYSDVYIYLHAVGVPSMTAMKKKIMMIAF